MKPFGYGVDRFRLPEETVALCFGSRAPARFWSRGLFTPEEAVEYKKKGWVDDTGPFAMKVENYPTN